MSEKPSSPEKKKFSTQSIPLTLVKPSGGLCQTPEKTTERNTEKRHAISHNTAESSQATISSKNQQAKKDCLKHPKVVKKIGFMRGVLAIGMVSILGLGLGISIGFYLLEDRSLQPLMTLKKLLNIFL